MNPPPPLPEFDRRFATANAKIHREIVKAARERKVERVRADGRAHD